MNNFFLNKKIEINFYSILTFLTFYSYTFYGIISKNYNLIFTIISVFLFVFFYFFYKKKNLYLILNINLYNLLIFFLILFISLILNYIDLSKPLHGDEYANALRTQRTAIFVIYNLLDNINLESLKELRFNNLIHILSFIELLFLIFVLILIIKKRNITTLFILLLFTLAFRYFLKDFGMHPPLNHFSSFMFTSLFGFKDFIFRFSYIFIYAAGNFLLYLNLKKYLNNNLISIFFIFFALTLPICILSSSNIDHSVWGYVFLLNFLIYYYFEDKIDYKLVVLLICIFAMARITIFILILPVLIEYIYVNKNKSFLQDTIITFAPVLFFFPFILKTFLLGSNVHNINITDLFSYIIDNIYKHDYFNVSNFFIQFHILILFFVGVFFVLRAKKYLKNINILITFLIYLVVYNSIESNFIGHPKYIFEFIIPFVILFVVQVFVNYKKFSNYVLIILIFLNILNLKKIESKIYFDKSTKKKFQIRKRFNYDRAFEELENKKLKLSNNFIGVYYGFVTEIFYDYNFKELKQIRSNNLRMKKKLQTNSNLNNYLLSYKNINSLMIIEDSFLYEKQKFQNWKKIDEFFFLNYEKNKIRHLVR